MQQEPEGQEPWILINQLSNLGEIKYLDNGISDIDPSIKALLVIHPKALAPQTLYAIDQFVMNGGNIFIAVDPYCSADQVNDPSNPQAGLFADHSSQLKELLGPWGVEMIEKKAVGDINLAAQVSTSQGSLPEEFLLWLQMKKGPVLTTEVMSSKDMTTSKLENMVLPWAGALKITPVPGITVDTLLQSTTQAQLFDEADYKFGGGRPSTLLSKYIPGTQAYPLAVRLSGKFKSTFAEKPSALTGASASAPQVKEGKSVSHIVVVSDVDFLSDMVAARTQSIMGSRLVNLINDNLPFAGNVVENLLGSNDLISLRSRGQFTRPFTRVEEIERHAAERWRHEEMTFQSTLNEANSRLTELQEGMKPGSEQVFNKALLDEVKQLREERQNAQDRLRDVRRNLRQDKERLGKILFVMNTFLVPVVLILGTLIRPRRRGRGTPPEKVEKKDSNDLVA